MVILARSRWLLNLSQSHSDDNRNKFSFTRERIINLIEVSCINLLSPLFVLNVNDILFKCYIKYCLLKYMANYILFNNESVIIINYVHFYNKFIKNKLFFV